MSEPAVNLDAWREILNAYRESLAAIDKAFAGPPPALSALAAQLRGKLDALRKRLDALDRRLPGGKEAVREVLVPLAFLLDEKVLAKLATIDLEVKWPLLGRTFGKTDFGGDAFIEKAEKLRDDPSRSPLVSQVYLFCLEEGFVGRYADEPEELKCLRRELFKKLLKDATTGETKPTPGPQKGPGELPEAPGKLPEAPRPIWQSAGAVVRWIFGRPLKNEPPGPKKTPRELPEAPRPIWQFAVAVVVGVLVFFIVLWVVSSRL